jgi:hypothetical protein
MLGEPTGELRGKRTGRRVLPAEHGFKIEVSFEDAGKLLGVDVQEVATYCSSPRPDGTLYGGGGRRRKHPHQTLGLEVAPGRTDRRLKRPAREGFALPFFLRSKAGNREFD